MVPSLAVGLVQLPPAPAAPMLTQFVPPQNCMTWVATLYFMVPRRAAGPVPPPAVPFPAVPATCQVVPSQNRGTCVTALYPRSPKAPTGLAQAEKAEDGKQKMEIRRQNTKAVIPSVSEGSSPVAA